MTREEAIDCNKNLRMYMRLSDKNQPYKFLEENYIALDMAIKALEQEPLTDVLDKIRAEIEFEIDHRNYMLCAEDVFAILDKYKAESEEKE